MPTKTLETDEPNINQGICPDSVVGIGGGFSLVRIARGALPPHSIKKKEQSMFI